MNDDDNNTMTGGAIPWQMWLELNHLSRSYGFKLLRERRGPRLILIGQKKYVSPAAQRDWLIAEEERANSDEMRATLAARKVLCSERGKLSAQHPNHPSVTKLGRRKLNKAAR